MTMALHRFRVGLQRQVPVLRLPRRSNVLYNTLYRHHIASRLPPLSTPQLWLSTTTPSKTEKSTKDAPTTSHLEEIVDISTKGVGQVIFLNSKSSGQILLASLAIGDPFLVSMAMLGS